MGIIEKLRLDGKTAFVTGGARGIGKSVATAFCEAGADVAIVDIDPDEAEKTAAALAAGTGARTLAVRADVTDPADVDAMMASILARYGKLDVAFCNAGICRNIPAEEMSYEQWRSVVDVNLTGVFLTAQAAGRQMLRQGGGSIITPPLCRPISSMSHSLSALTTPLRPGSFSSPSPWRWNGPPAMYGSTASVPVISAPSLP